MNAHEMANTIAVALTDALRADHTGVQQLIDTRVQTTEAFLDLPHPFIVNAEAKTLGPLGVINGVLLMLGGNRIAAHYDDSGKLDGFWPCDANGREVPRKEP